MCSVLAMPNFFACFFSPRLFSSLSIVRFTSYCSSFLSEADACLFARGFDRRRIKLPCCILVVKSVVFFEIFSLAISCCVVFFLLGLSSEDEKKRPGVGHITGEKKL